MLALQLSAAEKAAVRTFIKQRPPGDSQAALMAAYGDFRPRKGKPMLFGADAAWVRANMASFELAIGLPGMRTGPNGRNVVDLHRKVGPIVQIGFREIRRLGLTPNVRRWNGAWVVRQMRTGGAYSLHSWGIAFDLNAASNAQGTAGAMDRRVVEVFCQLGLTWGGFWTGNYQDAMHLQGADTLPGVVVPPYQDAAAK